MSSAPREANQTAAAASERPTAVPPASRLPFIRLGVGGIFMGLANIVPGVSGGTMVLALGLYDEFIGAVSDLTRLRVSWRAAIVVAMLFGISALTILGLSTVVQYLMEMSLPGMLALFIGLTLGGAPMLYRQIKPLTAGEIFFVVLGIAIMAAIAFLLKPDVTDPSWLLLFFGGIVGSSAMILPGISGSYMLLILGLYLPIIAGISEFKEALKAFDIGLLLDVGLAIILPVGLGLVVGVVLLANILRFLLDRHHRPTVGFLIGLLLGSVLGLYPFKEPSFEKLPRYAQLHGEQRILFVTVSSDGKEGGDQVVVRKLMDLEDDFENLRVQIDRVSQAGAPTVADVATASEREAVLVAYDVNVPREVRRAAEEGDVELIIVPNTEYSPLKGVMVGALVVIGFLITFMLARFGNHEVAATQASGQVA